MWDACSNLNCIAFFINRIQHAELVSLVNVGYSIELKMEVMILLEDKSIQNIFTSQTIKSNYVCESYNPHHRSMCTHFFCLNQKTGRPVSSLKQSESYVTSFSRLNFLSFIRKESCSET
jgi:hypothetical protein